MDRGHSNSPNMMCGVRKAEVWMFVLLCGMIFPPYLRGRRTCYFLHTIFVLLLNNPKSCSSILTIYKTYTYPNSLLLNQLIFLAHFNIWRRSVFEDFSPSLQSKKKKNHRFGLIGHYKLIITLTMSVSACVYNYVALGYISEQSRMYATLTQSCF